MKFWKNKASVFLAIPIQFHKMCQNEICNTKQVDCIAYISSLPQLSVYMLTTAMPELI